MEKFYRDSCRLCGFLLTKGVEDNELEGYHIIMMLLSENGGQLPTPELNMLYMQVEGKLSSYEIHNRMYQPPEAEAKDE